MIIINASEIQIQYEIHMWIWWSHRLYSLHSRLNLLSLSVLLMQEVWNSATQFVKSFIFSESEWRRLVLLSRLVSRIIFSLHSFSCLFTSPWPLLLLEWRNYYEAASCFRAVTGIKGTLSTLSAGNIKICKGENILITEFWIGLNLDCFYNEYGTPLLRFLTLSVSVLCISELLGAAKRVNVNIQDADG